MFSKLITIIFFVILGTMVLLRIMPEKMYSKQYLLDIEREKTNQVMIHEKAETKRTELTSNAKINTNAKTNNTVRFIFVNLPIYLVVGGIMLILIRLANPQYIEKYFQIYQQKQQMQKDALDMLKEKRQGH